MTGGSINFIDGSITTNGSLSFGESAFSCTINLTNVSVLSGDIALDASQLGVINFTNGTLGTQGGYVGPAVFSQFGANINLNSSIVQVADVGIQAINGGQSHPIIPYYNIECKCTRRGFGGNKRTYRFKKYTRIITTGTGASALRLIVTGVATVT